MTDAQQLFDFARRQFNEIADDVERHFELVAGQLREWIPSDSPFALPPPAPRRLPPPTTFQVLQRWMSKHRALTAAAVAFIVTGSVGAFVYAKNKQVKKKRRARKSASGARTDVVVLAGSVSNPLTSALYLELERRGFVVYIVTNTGDDAQYVKSQSRIDLLPLPLDLIDPFAAQDQLSRFQELLAREHKAFDGAEPHRLSFTGLILAPDTQGVPARIENISSEEWSDALNAKMLNTIATTQLFLSTIIEHKAKIMLLTPSVTPSLRPPTHAVESTVYGALEGFISSLATEMKDDGVTVTHFKLGNLDVPSVTAKQRRDGAPVPRVKATPLRKLHDSVFDALVSKPPLRRTFYVGQGSLAYDVIGSWIPVGVVGWMMGLGRKPNVVVDAREDDLRGSFGSSSWEKVEQDV